MKEVLPLAIVSAVAYFMFKGGGAGSMSALLSNAVSTLPAKATDPGTYTGPPATVNPMEGASTPEAQIAAQRAIDSGSVGNVPRDTQLVFASYNRHWANQLGGEVRMTAEQWNGYRARYVAAYGGEEPNPNMSMMVGPDVYMTAGEYLSRVNDYRAAIGKPSLGSLGCVECGGTCGMEGWV